MSSSQPWNSHQRYKFLRAKASKGHFEILSLGNGFSRGFQEVFSTADTMLFCQNTRKTGNNAVKMPQVFQNIARFKRFTSI